ncbi:MAG: helicase C-terminal domain-containing protein [bacterium]
MKEIEKTFGPEGLIASKLAGYETRPGQIKMASAVWQTVETEGTLIVEAGTGTGKSLAYLVPFIFWAVRNKKRVVISTFTKALQQQLIDSDLPFLAETLSKELSFCWALCLGGQNYLCLRRLEQTRQLGMFESQEEEITHILDWRKKTETGLRVELEFEVSPDVWSQICRESDLCLSGKCAYGKDCFYQRARFTQYRAQILVVNHHLYFAHLASGEQVLPEFSGLVFDEAHTIEDVATDFLGLEVSNSGVKYVLDNIHNPRTEKGLLRRLKNLTSKEFSRLDALRTETQTASEAFFSNLADQFGRESRSLRLRKPNLISNILYEPLAGLASGLREMIKKADSQEEEIEIMAASQRCATVNHSLKHILEQDLADHVYWLEIQRRLRFTRFTLKASPLNVGEELKERVFSVIKPAVLTSATLTTAGRFDYIRDRLGLDSCKELVVSSPFDYEKQVILYLPQGMPDPKEGSAYLDSLTECLKTLLPLTSEHRVQNIEPRAQKKIRLPHSEVCHPGYPRSGCAIRQGKGGTFILFTSFAALNQVYQKLKDSLTDRDVFKQGELPTARIIEKFKEGRHSILFGTNTFWQGVDVPGEDLISVIITKLPFAVPDEPITQARTEYLTAKGKNPFWDYQVPQAVILLRQGFGRLIRTQKDRGLVTICDPRIRTKSYGRIFLDSLPRCRVTSDLEEVKRFLDLLTERTERTPNIFGGNRSGIAARISTDK